ncbi:MAG: L,D-transpeptidase [Catenulispora sp.]
MRTSGAGKGGLLVAVAGAVAIGVAGCGAGSSGTKTDSLGHAGTGVDTGSSTSTSNPTTPSPTPTSASTSASSSSPASSSSSSASSSSTSSTSVPSSSSSSTPKPKPSTPSTKPSTTPTSHPSTPKPSNPGGAGWLAGVPHGRNTPGALDPRCMTGRVVCIDMNTRTLLWVVDGKPQYGMDVRFGDENNPTRKGKTTITLKMKDCISTIYHTPMPDAMFFNGGEAVHFSIDFATYGYAHHSHGCVNVRDRAAVDRLFADTRLGDTVVVY